jgi:hypothetical protein
MTHVGRDDGPAWWHNSINVSLPTNRELFDKSIIEYIEDTQSTGVLVYFTSII